MSRNLILVFAIVVVAMLGLTDYHLSSVNKMATQPVPFFHWEDTSGVATLRQVMQVRSFQPVQKRRINFGYTESTHWFRFRLAADSLPTELSFEIRNHTIDEVELFEAKNGRIASLGRTGSRLPFVQRPSPTKTFVYLLAVDAGQQVDYYLKLDKRYENLATELILWKTSDFEDKEQREYFLWGIYIGVVALVVLLAFSFFTVTHDPVYNWYGLYILGLSLRQLADTGLGFQYVWPQLPAINHPDAVIMALWLYLPAILHFQQLFLQLRTESRPIFWSTQVIKFTFLSLFVALVLAQAMGVTQTYTGAYRLITQLHVVLANCAFLLFMAIIVIGFRSGDTVKRLYVIGFGIQILGQFVIVAQNLVRYQPDGFFFVDSYMILMVNFFIDLVIFSYLLAYRYRKSLDERRRLRISLVQTRQQTNEAIIDVLESERQQVGNLLVVEVGGRLTTAQTALAEMAASPLLSSALDLIRKTEANLDQILRDSLPPDLTQKGLAAALAELVHQRDQTGNVRLLFNYECAHPDQSDLTATQTRQLYRITNELINNLTKHARATEGHVSLCQTTAGWQLTVSDNGQGFDVARTQTADGIGLKNLYARAQTIDATISLDSGPTGTTVTLLLPEKIQTS